MTLQRSFYAIAGVLLLQVPYAAQARDLTVWDVKQKCFREAAGGECGSSYNVTTRTFASITAQKAGAANADLKSQPAGLVPVSAPAALKPSESLRELAQAEAAAKQELAAGQPKAAPPPVAAAAAQAGVKAPTGQDEWDVASPAKKAKTEPTKAAAEAAAKTEVKKPAATAETTVRRGIRKTTAKSAS